MFKTHDTVFERIKLIGEASARTRYAFAATTLACSLIIASVASSYLTWMHSFALKASLQTDPAKAEVTDILKKKLLEEWVASQFITVPILGLRVSVSEVSIFGPFTIVVLLIWYYYSQRRESVAIRQVLDDLREDYSSGRHELVDVETPPQGDPSPSTPNPDIQAGYGRHLKRLLQLVSNQLVFITIDSAGSIVAWPLWALRHMLPTFTIVAAATVDVLTFDFVKSWCIPGAFRHGHQCIAWSSLEPTEKSVAYFMLGFSVLGTITSIAAALALHRHSSQTKEAMRSFREYCRVLDPAQAPSVPRPKATRKRKENERST